MPRNEMLQQLSFDPQQLDDQSVLIPESIARLDELWQIYSLVQDRPLWRHRQPGQYICLDARSGNHWTFQPESSSGAKINPMELFGDERYGAAIVITDPLNYDDDDYRQFAIIVSYLIPQSPLFILERSPRNVHPGKIEQFFKDLDLVGKSVLKKYLEGYQIASARLKAEAKPRKPVDLLRFYWAKKMLDELKESLKEQGYDQIDTRELEIDLKASHFIPESIAALKDGRGVTCRNRNCLGCVWYIPMNHDQPYRIRTCGDPDCDGLPTAIVDEIKPATFIVGRPVRLNSICPDCRQQIEVTYQVVQRDWKRRPMKLKFATITCGCGTLEGEEFNLRPHDRVIA